MRRQAGFTLVEVLIAMLIGTIGLLGTIAVQQAIINSSKNANDAAIAMRLATQKVEQLNSRSTDSPAQDALLGLHTIAGTWLPVDGDGHPATEYVDAEGNVLQYSDNGSRALPDVPTGSQIARYRWRRQWRVVDTGNLLPYVISVFVTYDNDVGTPKTVRIDMERRKSWSF